MPWNSQIAVGHFDVGHNFSYQKAKYFICFHGEWEIVIDASGTIAALNKVTENSFCTSMPETSLQLNKPGHCRYFSSVKSVKV
jgi:hypothetical protein